MRVLPLLLIASLASAAAADTVWVAGGELTGVQVKAVNDGKLVFDVSGRETSRDLRQVTRLDATGEPALNAAEEAFAAGRFDAATDGYRKALASSTKPWVKLWAAQRLSVAGQKANRFDAAASGYVALLVRDPARAAEFKPPTPSGQSTVIPTVVADVRNALATPGLPAESKQALTAYLTELQPRQQPSPAATAETVAAAVATENARTTASQQARARLDAAGAALDRKDFGAAASEIRANASLFTDPPDQAQALYLLAEAQAGLTAATNDVSGWQDAAIAYLRVVAHFGGSTVPATRPLAARSLLKAAQIQHDKLADAPAAAALCQQLTQEFPADPAAAQAKTLLQRLQH
jgi:TolA-binding protein